MTDGHRWPITWQGRWIWSDGPGDVPDRLEPPMVLPPDLWNRFCLLRRRVDLQEVPESVPVRVTADSRFVLFLNGVEVARGPARAVPPVLAYTTADLAPRLRPGENVIGALVRFYGRPGPWWVPTRPAGELGYGSFLFEALAIEVVSDRSWRACAGPYRQDVPTSPWLPHPGMEVVDGDTVPSGWTEPGFDDSGWAPAVELWGAVLAAKRWTPPCDPYPALEPDGIAPLTAIPVAVDPIGEGTFVARTGDDPLAAYPDAGAPRPAEGHRYVVHDAGGITLATPWVEVRGAPGSLVDLYASEDLRPDGLPELGPRYWSLRYRLGSTDTQRVEAFEAVGFRYVAVALRGDVELAGIGAIERRHPRSESAGFVCDDDVLDRVWATGARTLELCTTDAFIDCPGREQRAWVGDAYLTSLVTFAASEDTRLALRNLRLCADTQRSDGLLAMVAAGDFGLRATTIPDFSLHWVRAVARYHEHTGDELSVRELVPTARGVCEAFERHRGADDLLLAVPSWVFVDWAMTERDEVTGVLDALYALALDDLAGLLERVVGDTGGAAVLRARADRTRAAFEALWDPGRGVYVDAASVRRPGSRVSQHTNALAILAGCAPPERWDGMLAAILDTARLVVTPTLADEQQAYFTDRLDPALYMDFDPERHVVAAQPWFRHFVHAALVRAGRRHLLADLCRDWEGQLGSGNGTFEEFWEAPEAGIASRCHVWAATPTYDLTAHVLGVRPASPGFGRTAIRPLFGSLTRLSGRVPTPHGLVEVDVTRDGGTIVVPDGVTADVFFEDADLPAATLAPGTHQLQEEPRR